MSIREKVRKDGKQTATARRESRIEQRLLDNTVRYPVMPSESSSYCNSIGPKSLAVVAARRIDCDWT